jgi:cell wall-associated NlpC family hydrolase
VSAPNGGAAAAIAAGQSVLGTPYRWGGTSPATGFDCSGFTSWAWAQAGVRIPRTSRAQFAGTQRVPLDQLQPGDLVFFGSPIHHVGLYIGGGMMMHSPRTGDVAKISPIYRGFGSPVGAGRVR